jgi:hypothetical protein
MKGKECCLLRGSPPECLVSGFTKDGGDCSTPDQGHRPGMVGAGKRRELLNPLAARERARRGRLPV